MARHEPYPRPPMEAPAMISTGAPLVQPIPPTRWWRRKWVRIPAILIAFLAISLVIGTLCLNYLAAKRWQKLMADLKAAGEAGDFLASLPRVPEDSENFGAAGALHMVASVRPEDAKTAEANRAALLAIGYDRNQLKPGDDPVPNSLNGVDFGIAWSPEDWAEHYRNSTGLQMPAPSGNSGKDIIAAFAPTYEAMKPLVAAVERPQAVLTPEWPKRGYRAPIVMADQAHMTPFINLARILTERAQAAVAAGEPQMAVDDIRVLLRLAELVASDHLVIDALVSMTMLKMAQDPIWSLLRSRTANEQQLQSLMDSLSRVDLRQILLNCYRGELLAALDYHEWAPAHEAEAGELDKKSLSGMLAQRFTDERSIQIISALMSLAPKCFGQDAESEVVERYQNCCILPLRDQGLKAHFKAVESLRQRQAAAHLPARLWNFMADLQWRSFEPLALNAVHYQCCHDQALTACALERHWLTQKSYPDRLEDLSSPLSVQSSIDLMDNKPMRYKRTSDGRYVLWSVGLDETDDGGKVNLGKAIPGFTTLHTPDYRGDWVWSYEPLVKDDR